MKSQQVVKSTVKNTNKLLDILIKHFNINNFNYKDTVGLLEIHSNNKDMPKDQIRQAKDLLSRLHSSIFLKDERHLLNKFNDITNKFELSNTGIKSIIIAYDSIIHDLSRDKEWLKEYKEYLRKYQNRSIVNLEVLGKAILGRAIELCPIRTGYLRSSGALVVYENKIEIMFLAPYATYVHENMDAGHLVGQAKFLETAVQEFLPTTSVWTEQLGEGVVFVSIDKDLNVNYKHYGS